MWPYSASPLKLHKMEWKYLYNYLISKVQVKTKAPQRETWEHFVFDPLNRSMPIFPFTSRYVCVHNMITCAVRDSHVCTYRGETDPEAPGPGRIVKPLPTRPPAVRPCCTKTVWSASPWCARPFGRWPETRWTAPTCPPATRSHHLTWQTAVLYFIWMIKKKKKKSINWTVPLQRAQYYDTCVKHLYGFIFSTLNFFPLLTVFSEFADHDAAVLTASYVFVFLVPFVVVVVHLTFDHQHRRRDGFRLCYQHHSFLSWKKNRFVLAILLFLKWRW